jgi:outer membrane protein assembly factor BamB
MYKYIDLFRKDKKYSAIKKAGEYCCFLEIGHEATGVKLIFLQNNNVIYESGYPALLGGIDKNFVTIKNWKLENTERVDLQNGTKEVVFEKSAVYVSQSRVYIWYDDKNKVKFSKDKILLWEMSVDDLNTGTYLTPDKYFVSRGMWSRDMSELSVRNIYTGELLWHTNVEDFPELYPTPLSDDEEIKRHLEKEQISTFLVYEDILFVSTGWGRTFGFDLATGKNLWNLEFVLGGEVNIYKDQVVKVSLYRGAETITHVSIKTGEIIKQYNFMDSFKKVSKQDSLGFLNMMSVFEDKLYVVNPRGTIAIFNLETDQTEQYIHFEPIYKAGGPKCAPVLEGDYMYILDDKNKLHVFSRK